MSANGRRALIQIIMVISIIHDFQIKIFFFTWLKRVTDSQKLQGLCEWYHNVVSIITNIMKIYTFALKWSFWINVKYIHIPGELVRRIPPSGLCHRFSIVVMCSSDVSALNKTNLSQCKKRWASLLLSQTWRCIIKGTQLFLQHNLSQS